MLTINLALVSEVESHDPSGRRSRRHRSVASGDARLCPVWRMEGATVDALPTLEDVPVGYWPLLVVADVKGAAGVLSTRDGQPFALIEMSDSWSLTASHEMLEMLADPWENRLVPGRSLKPTRAARRIPGRGVRSVGRLRRSPTRTHDSARGLHLLARPRLWWQQLWIGQQKQFRDLRVLDAAAQSITAWIDSQTDHPGIDPGLKKSDKRLKDAVALGRQTAKSGSSRAAALRAQITRLRAA